MQMARAWRAARQLTQARLGPKRRKYVPPAVALSSKDWVQKLQTQGCKGGCTAEEEDVWTRLDERRRNDTKASINLQDLGGRR